MESGQQQLDFSDTNDGPEVYAPLRGRAARIVDHIVELQDELSRARRELAAINVLLETAGIEVVSAPEVEEPKPSARAAANRFDVQMPPRRPAYRDVIYREAVQHLLATHGEMTADELTKAVFEDASPEAFKLAKNALVGAISTDVRSGLFERPRRSTFRLKR